ncbi:M28 family peptidase [Maribacter sp.]|uniref:M28 family metallopeptidase n=1 Tax=Maribacter sp. TaxID=1897614 RepID=UPI0025C008F3|nr:M28 family peptidase [Maribacter sp.]
MRKIIQIVIVVFLVGCGSAQLKETDASKVSNNPEGVKGKIVGEENVVDNTSVINRVEVEKNIFSSSENISEIMAFLASDELQGRDSGTEGIEKAAKFIEAKLINAGVSPYFESYRDTISNFDKPAYNIVGFVEGSDPDLKKECIIIGAHYDHIGLLSGGEDTIANGANDNASGTSVVLELARYFGKEKINKRSIIFALFTAEEKGLLGSIHLANVLKTKNISLYAMLNYEMVGVPLVGKDYLMYATGYELSNLASVGNGYGGENLIGFLPKAKEYNLFKRSDNFPFHEVFNVPSQTFCTFDFTNFNHYHKVGDENELMDFNHMANVVNQSIPMIEGIVNSKTKEIHY